MWNLFVFLVRVNLLLSATEGVSLSERSGFRPPVLRTNFPKLTFLIESRGGHGKMPRLPIGGSTPSDFAARLKIPYPESATIRTCLPISVETISKMRIRTRSMLCPWPMMVR